MNPANTLQAPTVETPYNQGHIALEDQGREKVLRELFPYDYNYVVDSGILDMFYRDERYDGLLHTLAGNIQANASGLAAEGFHHEQSAGAVWPTVLLENGDPRPVTFVDRDHIAELSGGKRKLYREYPMEPYSAQVVVNGLKKYALHRDPKTQEMTLKPAKNSMYPYDYDALGVLQAVRIAYETRNVADDHHVSREDGRELIVAKGSAPLIDGKSRMNIRLVLDAASGKIVTAFPLLPATPGIMKLTDEALAKHVMETWASE